MYDVLVVYKLCAVSYERFYNMGSQDILNTTKLCLRGNFDEQVEYLIEHIRLTRQEVDSLVEVYQDLLMVLRQTWSGSELTPFGSIVTGLGIKTSDIDIHVNTHSNHHPSLCVKRAKNLLHLYPRLFREVFAISTAKVPIVKFLHTPTGFHGDINFSSFAGVRNSWVLAHLFKLDIRALHLAVLVKYWSKVHKLTGTNLLPNYALTLLVIFYFQQKLILPPICYLQMNVEPVMVDNWNMAFDMSDIKSNSSNFETLYELLGGFFEFYANFDFENNVISTFLGEVISRNDFSELSPRAPKQFSLYRYNVTTKIHKPLRLDTKMCIQDPFEHCRNCTVMVYAKLFTQLMYTFGLAKRAYQEHDNSTFLKKILIYKVPEGPIVALKPKVKHNFINKVKKNKPKINKNRFKGMSQNFKNQISKR